MSKCPTLEGVLGQNLWSWLPNFHLLVRDLTPAKKGSRFFASALGSVGSLAFKTSLLALAPPLDLPLLDLPPAAVQVVYAV